MGAIVRVEGLDKTFGARWVLRGLDLHAEPGTAVLLLGDNGSGKTTLLRILATLSKPTGGRVLIGADDAEAAEGAKARRRLGYVPHHPLVYDDLTGRENLELVGRAAGLSASQARDRADAWLDRVGLAERGGERAGSYSRGMKQRLSVARALVPKPDVVLLDEPGANLDEAARATLRSLLDGLKGSATVILATHEPGEVAGWADRVLRLTRGRLVEAGA
jgi:ABC-type multidrug transport system ATPase subunit